MRWSLPDAVRFGLWSLLAAIRDERRAAAAGREGCSACRPI